MYMVRHATCDCSLINCYLKPFNKNGATEVQMLLQLKKAASWKAVFLRGDFKCTAIKMDIKYVFPVQVK